MPKPRSRVQADIALPAPSPDGEIYLSGRQAAAVVGVTQQAILLWRKFGWLAEAAQEPSGRRLLIYRFSDVLAADARARGVAA